MTALCPLEQHVSDYCASLLADFFAHHFRVLNPGASAKRAVRIATSLRIGAPCSVMQGATMLFLTHLRPRPLDRANSAFGLKQCASPCGTRPKAKMGAQETHRSAPETCGVWVKPQASAFPKAPASREQVRAHACGSNNSQCHHEDRQTRPRPAVPGEGKSCDA